MKRKSSSMLYIAFLLMGLCFVMPTSAMAKGIFEHQDTSVPANQKVDDVVVVGGDATISGKVNDSVVIINGNLDLKATAKVTGFVLVIGGKVQQESGAVVTDEIINFSFDQATRNSLLIGGGLLAGTWLLQLAISVLLVILAVLTVFISRKRLHPFIERTRQTPGRLFYLGLFSCLILIAASMLLLITVIGIPIVFLILALMAVAFVVGMSVCSLLVGERIQGILGQADWLIALAGSIVLVSLLNVPFIGALLFLGILVFSIGIMTLWAMERLRRRA